MIICDLCKGDIEKTKDIRTWRKEGRLFVTCSPCKDKGIIPERIKIVKKTTINANHKMQEEKKRFRERQKRMELKKEKLIDDSIKRGIGNRPLDRFQ